MKKPGTPELYTESRQCFFECDISHHFFEKMALSNYYQDLYHFLHHHCSTNVSPSYFQAAYTNFEAENIELFLYDSIHKFQHIATNMLLPSINPDHQSSTKFFDLFLINSHLFVDQSDEISHPNLSTASNIATTHYTKFVPFYESNDVLMHVIANENNKSPEISTLLTFEGLFPSDYINYMNDPISTVVQDENSLISPISISEALQMAIAITNKEEEDEHYTVIKTNDLGPNGQLIYVYARPNTLIVLSEHPDIFTQEKVQKKYIEYGLRKHMFI